MLGTKVLEERESNYNGHLRVVTTLGMGTYIQADGLTQSGGIVESIWKSTLRHILHTKYDIQSVLILGLGGGTVAKLARKFWPDSKITGVDIDPLMIELGKTYLGLDETEVEIKIQDAAESVPGGFDLVVVDLYRGDKFPKKFESIIYLRSLAKYHLVIFNRLSYKDNKHKADKFSKKLKSIFGKVETYRPVTNVMYICKT
jgi:spermidine synthase